MKFCPKCGKDTDDLFNGLCSECFMKNEKPAELPLEIFYESCKNCGKIKVKGKWTFFEPELLAGIALQNLKTKKLDSFKPKVELFEKPKGWKAAVKIFGKMRKNKLEFSLETLMKPRVMLCDACMKVSSDYFEATVQVRFEERASQEQLAQKLDECSKFLAVLQKEDSLSQIVKAKELKNGLDIMVGSRRAAKQLAEHLARPKGQKIIVSTTLAGIDKKGHDWSRFTYCVRV